MRSALYQGAETVFKMVLSKQDRIIHLKVPYRGSDVG